MSKMQQKGALELVNNPGPSYYIQLFLVQKALGMQPVINVLSLIGYVNLTKFKMKTISLVLGLIRKRDSFSQSTSRMPVSTFPFIWPFCLIFRSLEGKVYQLKALFQPFYSSFGLHQSVCSGFRVGSQE